MPQPSRTTVRGSHAWGSFAPDLSLLGVATIWGVNIAVMKTGLEQIHIFVFSGVRLAISALVLVWLARVERRPSMAQSATNWRWQIALYAILVSGIYQVLFLVGIHWTTAGNTALIIATVPMWTALLARVLLGEMLTMRAWCGLITALSGTVIVAWQKGDVSAGAMYRSGNLLILAAALAWAGGTVYSRPLLTFVSPAQLSAASSVIALPIHLALAVPFLSSNATALASGPLWLIILYSGVLSSGLAQPMWHFGVRHAGPSHASVIQNAIPLVALLAAWTLRGTRPTAAQLEGGALILTGLVVMRSGRQALC